VILHPNYSCLSTNYRITRTEGLHTIPLSSSLFVCFLITDPANFLFQGRQSDLVSNFCAFEFFVQNFAQEVFTKNFFTFCDSPHSKSRNLLEGVNKFPFRFSVLILLFE